MVFKMNKQLSQVLNQFHGEDVVFIPNPGNAGDSFITCATYQLLADLGLPFRVGSCNGTYPGSVMLYAGGGNLIGEYTNAIRFIRNNHAQAKALVVLPHTIDAFADTLASLGSNCFIFCREQRSYAFVSQAVTAAQVFLSHDIALGADLQRIRQEARKAANGGVRQLDRHRLRLEMIAWRHLLRTGLRTHCLSAFRTDVEKTSLHIPPDNFDASAIFAGRDMSPAACTQTTATLIRFLSRYEQVRTNRLHICIMSLMLGKRVEFHPNSYYKNQAIYEHSLRAQFPLLDWKGPGDEADRQTTRSSSQTLSGSI